MVSKFEIIIVLKLYVQVKRRQALLESNLLRISLNPIDGNEGRQLSPFLTFPDWVLCLKKLIHKFASSIYAQSIVVP
jgi:hypothetical protein